jgi:glycosyltransferase involved in cell wall biosynthesis
MVDIIHVTTVHDRRDTRIRRKETQTLKSDLDVEVALYVQDGLGDEVDAKTGMLIHDIGLRAEGRLARMLLGSWRMYKAVRKAKPKIAHFHDPELLMVAPLWWLNGIKFIYDVHEEFPADIKSKVYLPAWSKASLSKVVNIVEQTCSRFAVKIVAATPTIAANFPKERTELVQNFPILDELWMPDQVPAAARALQFAYVGDVTAVRGPFEMVRALMHIETEGVRLKLAGRMPDIENLRARLKAEPGWQHVDYSSWLERPEIARLLSQSRAGLVVLAPEPNHVKSQPNKLFEYMAAGLPVIASDFPLWREIIDEAGCGLLVDPQDPKAIAKAMDWIIRHPEQADEMGQRGRKAVEDKYNWGAEGRKLIALYRDLLS